MTIAGTRVRWLVPWVVGLAILEVLFTRVDAAATWHALSNATFALYLPLSLGFIALWLILDVGALRPLLPREATPPSLTTLALLRASTYPLFAVNFHLASAALAAGISRELRVRVATASGSLLAYYTIDLLALSGLALLGSLTLDLDQLYIRGPLAALALGAVAMLACTRSARRWLHGKPAFRVLSEISADRVALALAMRTAMHASFAAFIVLGTATFGIDIPWSAALAHTPLVLAIGALPISVGSVGTAQAAIVFFFGRYASSESLLAFGLAYTFTLLVLRVPIGFLAVWVRGRAPTQFAESRA